METVKKIEVCHGPRCREYGGEALAARLAECGVEVKAGYCQSLCPNSPIVRIDGQVLHNAKLEDILETV